jgi:hypothetical protein
MDEKISPWWCDWTFQSGRSTVGQGVLAFCRTAANPQMEPLPAVPNIIAWASFVSSIQQQTESSRIPDS